MKKLPLIILPLICFVSISFGQDTISTKKQGELIVYVKSIESKKTKYTGSLDKKAKVFSIRNRKINYINLESGKKFAPNFGKSPSNKLGKEDREKKIITHKNSFGLEPFTTISKGLSFIGEFPIKNKFILQTRVNIAHNQIPINFKNVGFLSKSIQPYLHQGFSLSLSSPFNLGLKPFLPENNKFHNSWFILPEVTFQNLVEIKHNNVMLGGFGQYVQQEVVDQRTTLLGSLTVSLGKNFIIYDRIKLQASGGLGYYNIFKEYFYQNYPEEERDGFQRDPFYKLLRGVQILENNIMGNFSLSIHYLF
jgi:hypothetical protein